MYATLQQTLEWLFAYQVGNLAAWRVAAALAILFAGLLFHATLFTRIFSPLERLLAQTETEVDDYLVESAKSPVAALVYVLALYLGVRVLAISDAATETAGVVAQSLGTLIAAWLAFRTLDVGIHFLEDYTESTDASIDEQLVPVVRRITRLMLVVVSALLIVQQWGYDVSTLIAGLGIGGLAFALAARNMLSNWFGALMVFTDRPFEVGEWIETDYGTGAVEEVGLRSTRIRTYERERIVIPNGEIASGPITNHTDVDRRRIHETVGLVYGTTRDQLTNILDDIRALLDGHDEIYDDDWRAYFVGFGDSALEIEISCFVDGPDRTLLRETREGLFLEIARIVEAHGTEFAFPTRSVHLEGDSSRSEDVVD